MGNAFGPGLGNADAKVGYQRHRRPGRLDKSAGHGLIGGGRRRRHLNNDR